MEGGGVRKRWCVFWWCVLLIIFLGESICKYLILSCLDHVIENHLIFSSKS